MTVPQSGDSAGDTTLMAYIDESRKPIRDRRTGRVLESGDHYVVAAAIILAGDQDTIRATIVDIANELTGGKPIRWSDLAPTKRMRAVEAVVNTEHWEACVYETGEAVRRPHHTDAYLRSRTMTAALIDLSVKQGVERAVLETRSQPAKGFTTHDKRDNELLESLLTKGNVPPEFRITHQGKQEPILWLADIVAGLRTDYLCWVDRDLYPMISHRIRTSIAV